jgi:hypothetical protein
VKRDSANLVLNVRRDSKRRALQGALLVPWPLLAESAAAFAEWHMFILWVRSITETADQLPEIVRSALQSRSPGFLEFQSRERREDIPLWRSVEDWSRLTVSPKQERRAVRCLDVLTRTRTSAPSKPGPRGNAPRPNGATLNHLHPNYSSSRSVRPQTSPQNTNESSASCRENGPIRRQPSKTEHAKTGANLIHLNPKIFRSGRRKFRVKPF